MSYDKLQKVLELLENITDIYPEMEKIIMNDSDSPDYIILTTSEFLDEMSSALGLFDELEEVSFSDEYMDIPKKTKDRKLQ
jgi:hypothetical protein